MNDFLQFRFVPTMRCNLRCSYCFLDHSTGDEPTMFDNIQPPEWIAAMKKFSAYDVEFYMWGGEPFVLEGTYDLVKSFAEYDFVFWGRVDTNMTFAKNIIKRCPTPKVKLNCSWHTHALDFSNLWKLVLLLKQHEMVGMVNFVASEQNLQYLKENNLQLDDLVRKFQDQDLFLNVAAEFQRGDRQEYKDFILKYTCQEDWLHIHDQYSSQGVDCDAAQTFMFVDMKNGDLTSCGYRKDRFFRQPHHPVLGNFFTGKIKRLSALTCPQERCLSIVSYCHRSDNNLVSKRHLDEYVTRNIQHRRQVGTY